MSYLTEKWADPKKKSHAHAVIFEMLRIIFVHHIV